MAKISASRSRSRAPISRRHLVQRRAHVRNQVGLGVLQVEPDPVGVHRVRGDLAEPPGDLHVAPRARQDGRGDLGGPARGRRGEQETGVGQVGGRHGGRAAQVRRAETDYLLEQPPVAGDLQPDDPVQLPVEELQFLLAPRLGRPERHAPRELRQEHQVLLDKEPELLQRQRPGGKLAKKRMPVQPRPDRLAPGPKPARKPHRRIRHTRHPSRVVRGLPIGSRLWNIANLASQDSGFRCSPWAR